MSLPEEPLSPQCPSALQAVVGGLELSVAFAQQGDRERVLEAARLLGWGSEGLQEDSEGWAHGAGAVAVTVSTPRLWLPLHCLLLPGQAQLHEGTHCYLRYKLYDQEPTCTWLRRPELSGDTESVTVSFRKPSKVTLRKSQGLLWFFREEKLEIQVWWAYGKENEVDRPLDTDRLIGSAYVDLAALAERSRRTLSVSGESLNAGSHPIAPCWQFNVLPSLGTLNKMFRGWFCPAQSPRVVRVGMDLWRSPSPSPCPGRVTCSR